MLAVNPGGERLIWGAQLTLEQARPPPCVQLRSRGVIVGRDRARPLRGRPVAALNFVAAVTNSSNAEPERNFSSTWFLSSRKRCASSIQIAASLQDRGFKYDWIRGESAEQFVHMDENEACLEPSRHRRCNVHCFRRGAGKIRSANNWPPGSSFFAVHLFGFRRGAPCSSRRDCHL